MKKKLITGLGILDLLACVCMLILLGVLSSWSRSDIITITWGLPFIIMAIVNLWTGIYVLKSNNLKWTIAGLLGAIAVGIYFFIIAQVRSWMM